MILGEKLQKNEQLKQISLIITVLALLSLACSTSLFGENGQTELAQTTRTPQPTFTVVGQLPAPVPRDSSAPNPADSTNLLPPVPRDNAETSAEPTTTDGQQIAAVQNSPTPTRIIPTATATTGPTPTATATPLPFPTPAGSTAGWSIENIHVSHIDTDFTVTGELVNKMETPRENVAISATFYNQAGEVIKGLHNLTSFLPLDIIPIDIQVPFQLSVESPEKVYRYELQMTSTEAQSEPPRDDFEVSSVETWVDKNGLFCVKGDVENQGASVENSLVVLVKMYNSQDEMFSFSEIPISRPDTVQDGVTTPFESCVEHNNAPVANYEIVALGR